MKTFLVGFFLYSVSLVLCYSTATATATATATDTLMATSIEYIRQR